MGRIRAPIFRPNWSHPLNRGRVAWWLCQPNKLGGGTWLDLCGHNHGTLTSMGGTSGATNGFRSTTRPGGWGGVLFDGSAGYMSASIGSALTHWTAEAWVKVAAVGNYPMFVTMGNFVDLRLHATTGIPEIVSMTAGSAISLNAWHHLAGTWDGTTLSLYVDGTLAATGGGGATTGTTINLGRRVDDAYFGGGMTLDDVSIYSRALSAAEVQLDYTLSRQRYPGVLQSMPLRTYSVPSAGPVGNGLLMRRRRFLLGAA